MKYICKNCGSDHIICKAWAYPNTDRVDEYIDLSKGFCYNCGKDVEIIERVITYEKPKTN